MAPAYAYRFDSDHGSIVVSGDTTLRPNLLERWQRVAQRLGRGTRTVVVAGRDGNVIGTR